MAIGGRRTRGSVFRVTYKQPLKEAPTAAEVDAGDLVAVGAMTVRARGPKRTTAGLDVSCLVLGGKRTTGPT